MSLSCLSTPKYGTINGLPEYHYLHILEPLNWLKKTLFTHMSVILTQIHLTFSVGTQVYCCTVVFESNTIRMQYVGGVFSHHTRLFIFLDLVGYAAAAGEGT